MNKSINKKIKIVNYSEYLREDFILCCIKLKYISSTLDILEAYINHYEYGIIEIKKEKKEIHKWETEEQSHDSSYLSRRYTVTLLNGINSDTDFENNFIETVIIFIKNSNINLEIKNNLYSVMEKIKNYYT